MAADQRSGQDAAFVRATQALEPEAGMLRLWSEGAENCKIAEVYEP
jgi:hypothetical protein